MCLYYYNMCIFSTFLSSFFKTKYVCVTKLVMNQQHLVDSSLENMVLVAMSCFDINTLFIFPLQSVLLLARCPLSARLGQQLHGDRPTLTTPGAPSVQRHTTTQQQHTTTHPPKKRDAECLSVCLLPCCTFISSLLNTCRHLLRY